MTLVQPTLVSGRTRLPAVVRHLYISNGHNFFGHYGRPPGSHPMREVGEVECVSGRGIRGDRFFDYRNDYCGQITFFSTEVYESLCQTLSVWDRGPETFRRNVILEGVDLNALIGSEFQLQNLTFRGIEECRPCAWMNQAFASGAEELMRGRGGLRAEILTDGYLWNDFA